MNSNRESQAPLRDYFLNLTRECHAWLDKLPISLEPEPLDSIMARLEPATRAVTGEAVGRLGAITRPAPVVDPDAGAAGLNTIGMLADRLTILIIREWSLRNKGRRDEAKAARVREEQTTDIIAAMAATRPGTSALNSKITHISSDAAAGTWAEAYWGLFITNLLLWESQEVLYIKDIGQAPCEELRAYIKWFAEGNIRRNQFIQLCEQTYWS